METQTLEIVKGSYKDVAALPDLLHEHWLELAKNKDLMVLSPNLELYEVLESTGHLVTFIAKLDGVVVGYVINVIDYHPHYSKLLCSQNDLLFVAKEHRRSSVGGRLVRAMEQESAKRGAKFLTWHAKENTELSEYLPHTGCKVQEIIYSKEL
jgi:GNAT superfamily N-acetyltransferase